MNVRNFTITSAVIVLAVMAVVGIDRGLRKLHERDTDETVLEAMADPKVYRRFNQKEIERLTIDVVLLKRELRELRERSPANVTLVFTNQGPLVINKSGTILRRDDFDFYWNEEFRQTNQITAASNMGAWLRATNAGLMETSSVPGGKSDLPGTNDSIKRLIQALVGAFEVLHVGTNAGTNPVVPYYTSDLWPEGRAYGFWPGDGYRKYFDRDVQRPDDKPRVPLQQVSSNETGGFFVGRWRSDDYYGVGPIEYYRPIRKPPVIIVDSNGTERITEWGFVAPSNRFQRMFGPSPEFNLFEGDWISVRPGPGLGLRP